MNYLVLLAWVVARLKEPSTYAGVAGILAAHHVSHSGDIATQITAIGIAIASIAAIFLPENK